MRSTRVFANIGKAIAAFERSLTPPETRFDRFAKALAAGKQPAKADDLTGEERAGLKLFIGKAQCTRCHNGPRFTDGHFHNTGVPPVPGLPQDLGRETGVAKVAADPFNCLGAYRDGSDAACGELRFMVKDRPELRRAYKTPSLRGAATRPPYMHAGQIATLEAVIDHYATRAGQRGRPFGAQPADLVRAREDGAGGVSEDARSAGRAVTVYLSFTVSIATKVEVWATCGSAEMRSPSTRR